MLNRFFKGSGHAVLHFDEELTCFEFAVALYEPESIQSETLLTKIVSNTTHPEVALKYVWNRQVPNIVPLNDHCSLMLA